MHKNNLEKLNVAFMGNFSVEKGSRTFAEIVRLAAAEKLPITWWILGGIGDEESFQKASSFSQIKTTGFYSTTELPGLLASLHIELGLLLSVFPESYSKLSRECWQQRLPLIYHQIGILETMNFSDLGFAQISSQLPEVVEKLRQICDEPGILEEEKIKIDQAIANDHILSPNNKHEKYLAFYNVDRSA
jgi:hypothetical protein